MADDDGDGSSSVQSGLPVARSRSATSKDGRVRLTKLLSYAGGRRRKGATAAGTAGFGRIVFCNEPERHHGKGSTHKYARNSISTTKYNVLTFLPKSLYEQFRRVANLYFLLCACLALTPLSPYTPSSLIAPLVFVVAVSMIKEAVEDWRRWAADQEVNKRKVLVHVGNGEFEEREWQAVRVGDIVRVEKDAFFPADLLMLSSGYPDGVCYVETMNLDGETNLKLRKSLERTANLDTDEKAGTEFVNATIQCEDPNPSLYTFVGNLDWQGETSPIEPQQILLRDSKLRNTPFVYGCVIFTGHESKVMMNSTDIPSKRSSIERRMDKIVYLLFATLVLMAIVGSIVFGIVLGNDMESWYYLELSQPDSYYDPNNPALSATLQAITAVILYGYLIPISLYVSIEVVKVFQAWFISADRHMYHAATDKAARARTSNLNEELGQVDTILSDKTGTLTCNSMEFLKCSIAGTSYGRGITEVERATAKRLGIPLSQLDDYDPAVDDEEEELLAKKAYDSDDEDEEEQNGSGKGGQKVKGFALRDARLLEGKWMLEPHPEDLRMFLRILALCHTVIPDEDAATGTVKYEAESPDEAALVEAGRQLGFEFCRRTQTSVLVREPDPDHKLPTTADAVATFPRVEREYEVLNVIEFNSTRKRMSVVIKDPEGRIIIMCKGADSVIFGRLGGNGRQYVEATRGHLQRYGEAGLRTLALAYRELGAEEYEGWRQQYDAARTSLGSDRDSLLDAAAERIEQGLTLVGATAVEDKLQKGVPQTIDRLAQAGIKIWVLTGDKQETAINIGFACSLLRDDMTQIVVSLDNPEIRKLEDSDDKAKLTAVCQESVQKQMEDGAALVEQVRQGGASVLAKGGAVGVSARNRAVVVGTSDDEEEDDDEEQQRKSGGHKGNGDGDDDGAPVFALIIDGKSLLYALEGQLKVKLLALAMQCASVICCRVSPKQKALITRLVKDGTGRTTLGIGDGANDVGMIHEADIGVGISGVEGQQAVMASDFAIAQFKYLERLLLMHGHWCYKRIAGMVTYFFFKNVAFGLTIFFYNGYAMFTGQVVYNSWAAASYNVFFTSLPVIGYGVLEQDVRARSCFMFPALYGIGLRNTYFRWRTIARWMFNGVFVAVALFWFALAAVAVQAGLSTGEQFEMAGLGVTLMTGVVVAVNLQMALMTEHWTWISHLFLWGSIALWYIFLIIYSFMNPSFSTDWYAIFYEMCAPSALYWLTGLVLLPIVGVLPYFIYKAAQSMLCPPDDQLVNELVLKHRDEEAAKDAVAPLAAPVGFSAAVASVTKRVAKRDKKRQKRSRRGRRRN